VLSSNDVECTVIVNWRKLAAQQVSGREHPASEQEEVIVVQCRGAPPKPWQANSSMEREMLEQQLVAAQAEVTTLRGRSCAPRPPPLTPRSSPCSGYKVSNLLSLCPAAVLAPRSCLPVPCRAVQLLMWTAQNRA
jgi:hypothetical protein